MYYVVSKEFAAKHDLRFPISEARVCREAISRHSTLIAATDKAAECDGEVWDSGRRLEVMS